MRTVKVHMLATSQVGVIYKRSDNVLFASKNRGCRNGDQHLYFTSDEEIKEGDWFIDPISGKIWQKSKENQTMPYTSSKKIVATTDPALHTDVEQRMHYDLIIQGIPDIPESFILKYIEMYNAGTPITQFKIESIDIVECIRCEINSFDNPDRMLPCPRGGCESFHNTELKLRPDNTVIVHPIKGRTFTKAELEDAYDSAIEMMANGPEEPFYKWFERKYPSL